MPSGGSAGPDEGMLAAIMLVSATPAAVFAPDDGRTQRLTSTLTRTDGSATLHFSSERTIVFRRERTGWVAALALRSLTSDAPAAMRSRFQAEVRRTEHAPPVVRLDAVGTTLGVDDEDARWADHQQLMVGLPASEPGAAATAAEGPRMLASSLAGIAVKARRTRLAGTVVETIDTHEASLTPSADRHIAIPAFVPRVRRSPLPAGSACGATQAACSFMQRPTTRK